MFHVKHPLISTFTRRIVGFCQNVEQERVATAGRRRSLIALRKRQRRRGCFYVHFNQSTAGPCSSFGLAPVKVGPRAESVITDHGRKDLGLLEKCGFEGGDTHRVETR